MSLVNSRIALSESWIKIRTRMVNVADNFGNKRACPNCLKGQDDQQHLLVCIKLKIQDMSLLDEFEYTDIFSSDITKQKTISQRLQKSFRLRQEILDFNNNNSLI